MIEISIEGPNQNQKYSNVSIPCVLGRYADEANPELAIDDPFVSRKHVQIEDNEGGRLRIRCVGRSVVCLSNGQVLESGDDATVSLPIEITVGRSNIAIQKIDLSMSILSSPPSMSGDVNPIEMSMVIRTADEKVTNDQLIDWFQSLTKLQETAIGRKDFCMQAAKSVVDMIGLDRCVLLSREDGEWEVEVHHGESQPNELLYSHSVVSAVENCKKTIFDQSVKFDEARSLAGVSAFVASPILSGDGEMIACLFGSRKVDVQKSDTGVRPLQAQLVQVIAGIIGSRLARMDAEAEQTRTQVQLEQFASPALVREMQANPHWLEAQERELTMLFGDIRGFSTLSEQLSAADLYSFVRDTMDCMTNVIMQHGGYVFSYAGDGIAAMWNAPGESTSHASDACRAALAIQSGLASVDAIWKDRIGAAVQVGVGVDTGNALVGNSGSKARLHYSPLGRHVNLASRLEGATKQFGVQALISETTQRAISSELANRDLGEIAVVGIDRPVRVFQLADQEPESGEWKEHQELLAIFERGNLDEAKERAVLLLNSPDGPTKMLAELIGETKSVSDTVWKLMKK